MDEETLSQLYPELYGEESPAEHMSIITADILREQQINEQYYDSLEE